MRILNISESLEKIVSENELSDLANPLKNEFAISKSEDLRKAIFDMEDENRVLRVGIVGREFWELHIKIPKILETM